MIDIATMYNKYAFLGPEFLTWLWYASENTPERLNVFKDEKTELVVGNKVVIVNDNPQPGKSAKVTIQGEESDLKEAMLSVKDGGWVSDIHLRLEIGEIKYELTLGAPALKITGFKCSERVSADKEEEIDGAIMERIFLITKAMEYLDHVFERFIKARLNGKWDSEILPDLSAWIRGDENMGSKVPLNKKLFD